MRIVTWNVNSLKARAELVGRFLDEERPDLLAIQELKLPDERVPLHLFTDRGYHVAVHGQPRWNGVLLAARSPLADVHRGLPEADEGQARLIAARVDGLDVVNLYCPQGQSADAPAFAYKLRFYDALLAWLPRRRRPDHPLVVLGDLNIAPRPEDIWDPVAMAGVPSFHPEEHQRFRALLDLGLEDVVAPHVPPHTYTFWDYRAASFRFNRGMRIDHILAEPPVARRVARAWVGRDWRKKRDGLTPSDHAPVFAELAPASPR